MNVQILETLARTISDRKKNPQSGSYTNELLSAGENKIIKKLGEENAEYIKAFLTENDDKLAGEAADYLYHLMVSLEYRDVSFEKVLNVLKERHK